MPMSLNMSSIDLYFMIKELKSLIGSRLDKAYHLENDEIILQFHTKGEGKRMLMIVPGKAALISESKNAPENPSGFCMFLRKYLENSKITEISQIGSERVLMLQLENRSSYRIYAELFGKGNIIISDNNDIIMNALHQQKWSDREIRKGLQYICPEKPFSLFDISKADFINLPDSNEMLVLSLAKDFGFGGYYAEELCLRAGIDKKISKPDKKKKELLYEALKEILSEKIHAMVVQNKAKKIAIPIKMEIFSGMEGKEFGSFSHAMESIYIEENKKGFTSVHQNSIDSASRIIENQKSQLEELEKEAEINSKKGETIYENYALVDEVLKEIRKARKIHSIDEIKKRLKGHAIVKKFDGQKIMVSIGK